ncbi:GTP 3',8-cyclase MoaA [Rubinisphaera margarita]|uniref:GTP 3',8-cyclase MoaA n=1 Tax=Rubinisphaera margarita TaxID=2909586 RepID=UPI001EE8F693|nr:GTP 3',8-cyclase MoaA [Rubinisphaera margarita]MCG6158611.1 GTP 3',8-cyclase MoaA [Rubinisphaera margarita]
MTLHVLQDTFGRVHDNLRVSVTDRCNLRCFYCMPAENVQYLPRPEVLTFEEITRFVRVMIGHCGIRKIRLTGGEPLVRQNLERLIEQLATIPGLNDLALTTNGILLPQQAAALYAAGLRRLNISIDTLDRDRFQQMTRRDSLEQVLAGIEAARETGFHVKLNAVAIRGLTEEDLVPLAMLSRESGLEVRFIEYMPLDAERSWERDKVLRTETMLERLEQEIAPLVPLGDHAPSNPAVAYGFEDGRGRIGFISSISRPFCAHCNRFRLTADGKIRNCLFSTEETDLRSLLRSDASDDDLVLAVQQSISAKKEGHEINTARFLQPDRAMHSIGG